MKDTKKKKVVITFCEAGQGHIVTAQAILDSLKDKYSDLVDIEPVYIFRDSKSEVLRKYGEFSVKEVLKSNKNKYRLFMQMFAMKVFGERTSLRFVYSTVFKKVKKELTKDFVDMKADAIVSTYFVPHHIACCAKKKGLIDSKIITYNPDHNCHGWWDRRGDLFINNNPLATQQALKKHFKKNTVKTVNFLARKALIECNESKEFYREKYGIAKDKFAVILADGAYAAARLEEYTDMLLTIDLPLTIVAVCGKNTKLLEKYNKIKDNLPANITLMPLGFQTAIHELYKACDLFITKAGPNAITDCMFMNTPIMTNFYSGTIEKTTNKLFTEKYKTGIFCPDVKKAKKMIEDFIQNPDLLQEMRENTKQFDKNKNGADQIADYIIECLYPEKSTK